MSYEYKLSRRNCFRNPGSNKLVLNPGGPALWKFLEHKGPICPINYESINFNKSSFIYKGIPTKLSKKANNAAFYYARLSQNFPRYINKEEFDKSFFKFWRKLMTEKERKLVANFSFCDFTNLDEQLSEVIDKEEPIEEKDPDNEIEVIAEMPHSVIMPVYNQLPKVLKIHSSCSKQPLNEINWSQISQKAWCKVDSRKERLLNPTVESPGIFINPSPKTKFEKHNGKIRNRILPENIIINCSRDSKIPKPPKGRAWKKVIHNPRVPWIAAWKDNVTKEWKYINLNLSSNMKKAYEIRSTFDSARDIRYFIERFREKYSLDLKSDNVKWQQLGLVTYFIDKMSFTIQDSDSDSDMISCRKLKCDNVKLLPPNKFCISKNDNVVEFVTSQEVIRCLSYCMESKNPSDLVFSKVTSTEVKKYLKWKSFQVTPELLRIYNTSYAFNDAFKPNDFPNHRLCDLWNLSLEAAAVEGNFYDKQFIDRINTSKENLRNLEKVARDLEEEIDQSSSTCNRKNRKLTRVLLQADNVRKSLISLTQNKHSIENRIISGFIDPRIYLFHMREINGRKVKFPYKKFWSDDQMKKLQWAVEQAKESDELTIQKFNWSTFNPVQYLYDFDSTKYHYAFDKK